MAAIVPGAMGSPKRKAFRVLLAEDDGPLRALIRILLEKTGRIQVVGEAEDGRETILWAQKTRPDFILLDLSMPGMDGTTALPILRSTTPESQVICVSMLQRDGAEEEVLRLGAVAFVDKGHDSDLLVQQLLGIMDARRAATAQAVTA